MRSLTKSTSRLRDTNRLILIKTTVRTSRYDITIRETTIFHSLRVRIRRNKYVYGGISFL